MKIQITSLVSDISIENWLKSTFKLSGQFLKKNFSKKFLQKIIRKNEAIDLDIDIINHGMISPKYSGEKKPHIFFEDENFLGIFKPDHCHMHPLSYNEGDNLLSYLREVGRGNLLTVNSANYDRGLLYRLDYETSGVVIYAKTEELYQQVRKGFSGLVKKKQYHCFVTGDCRLQGTYVHYLKASGEKGEKMLASLDVGFGERAELFLTPLSYDEKNNATLLQVDLTTGLRHQIRVQLKALGFPIIGDPIYGDDFANSPRLYLEAHKYELIIEGRSYKFQLPLPLKYQ